jgi:hypothetical protein
VPAAAGGSLRAVRASVRRVALNPPGVAAAGGLGWDAVEVRVGCAVLPDAADGTADGTALELVYRVTPSADLVVSATLTPPPPPPSSSAAAHDHAAAAAAERSSLSALQPGRTVALRNALTGTHLDVEGTQVRWSRHVHLDWGLTMVRKGAAAGTERTPCHPYFVFSRALPSSGALFVSSRAYGVRVRPLH